MPDLPVVPIQNPKMIPTKAKLPGAKSNAGTNPKKTGNQNDRKSISEKVGSDSLPGWVSRNMSDSPGPRDV